MTETSNIRRTAALMVEQSGEDAKRLALEHVQLLSNSGEPDAQRVWIRVLHEIESLLGRRGATVSSDSRSQGLIGAGDGRARVARDNGPRQTAAMENNDSLIGRATAAIEEVMEGVERDLDQSGRAPSQDALAGRRALAEMIARSLHGRGMLHDPDDRIPRYRADPA
jgi:hypothetical protein